MQNLNNKVNNFFSNIDALASLFFRFGIGIAFIIHGLGKFPLPPQGLIEYFNLSPALASLVALSELLAGLILIISGFIIRKKILEKEKFFNEKYNIIGDYDLLMRISKYANAKSFNETLIFYRVHNNNFSKLNNKMYYYEYKDWYSRQKKINDDNFKKNKDSFLLQLNKLEIIYYLYQAKTFKLLIKIIKFPNFISKLKYLFAFMIPIKIVNYFRK